MLPLTVGMLIAGRPRATFRPFRRPRPFATGGMLAAASSFGLLAAAPTTSGPPRSPRSCAWTSSRGNVRLAQPSGCDEQPPPERPGGRRRHEPDLPELRPGALDRDLLHADDPRAGRDPADAPRRAPGARRVPRHREQLAHLPPVSILFAAFLGYNPIQHLLGPSALHALSAHDQAALIGIVLPEPDLGAVPGRPARSVRLRDRRVPRRGGGVAHARRAEHGRRGPRRACDRPGAAPVESRHGHLPRRRAPLRP